MVTTRKLEYLTRILSNNPKVSPSVVAQSAQLEDRLKQLGIELKPRYALSPPLGDSTRQIHNHSKK